MLNRARRPVLMLGMMASTAANARAVRDLLTRPKMPVVCTYQGAGVAPRTMLALFGGRVRLFHNQPADKLLDSADVVATVGFDPIEYGPSFWNRGKRREIIHIDALPADIDNDYRPAVELIGDIAACLARPGEKVISLSGDGGFHFSAMEPETAVRLKCHFVHLVWTDGYYDMVRIQQKMKYGREAAVRLGPVDLVTLAQAFGAVGMRIKHADEIAPTLPKALAATGPVVVDVPVDYSENYRLIAQLHPGTFH